MAFYEKGDPKGSEFLGRNSGSGVGVDASAGENQVQGSIMQGVAVIKQALIVDSPLYLQVGW